jgi:hypothetical protein
MLPAQLGELLRPAPEQERTPAEDYIDILRSYLSGAQKRRLRRLVEQRCLHHGLLSMIEYADLLQSFLTPCQRAGVVERLEAIFSTDDPADLRFP